MDACTEISWFSTNRFTAESAYINGAASSGCKTGCNVFTDCLNRKMLAKTNSRG